MTAADDRAHMNAALALARRGLGDTWPNPAVGCVLVRDGRVVGRGWTQSGGRPHAETEALARAGAAAKGGTAYVTLEPCSHQGKTPPCADALVAAGVARVVIATRDPDARVDGKGVAKLQAAGIVVDEGLEGEAATALNAGFFSRVSRKRPLFALKTATTLDGRIALASGESRWITGEDARHAVQVLRACYDAILVGSGTAVIDNPGLECRLAGYTGRPKVRVVLDRRLRITPAQDLIKTARITPTWVVTSDESAKARGAALETYGATVIVVPADGDARAFARAAAQELAARGLTRVLIEGGGQLAASFLGDDMVDEVAWFRGARLFGGDARPAVGNLNLTKLTEALQFHPHWRLAFGEDTLDLYQRRAAH